VLLLYTDIRERLRSHPGHDVNPQVMLALVIFDRDGKLMVTRDGALPTRPIANLSNKQVPILPKILR
jgi:hypothetical protein